MNKPSEKEIKIVSWIMVIPAFVFLFIGLWFLYCANVSTLAGIAISIPFTVSGAWAAMAGQERLYQLRKHGYTEKRKDKEAW